MNMIISTDNSLVDDIVTEKNQLGIRRLGKVVGSPENYEIARVFTVGV